MKILLDTHVFLWYVADDPRLPASFTVAIREPRHEVYLSVVSVWEAVVKHGLGKLPFPAPPATYLPLKRDAHGIVPLAIDEGAMAPLAGLPPLHRDPFDRMLIAQAIQHGLTIITVDAAIAAYPVPQLPAGYSAENRGLPGPGLIDHDETVGESDELSRRRWWAVR